MPVAHGVCSSARTRRKCSDGDGVPRPDNTPDVFASYWGCLGVLLGSLTDGVLLLSPRGPRQLSEPSGPLTWIWRHPARC